MCTCCSTGCRCGWQRALARLHAVLSVLFFAGLLTGSAWLLLDLWNGHEESELLRVPYRPLRIAVVLMLAALSIDALRRIVQRTRA